jgi:hypothetical protein
VTRITSELKDASKRGLMTVGTGHWLSDEEVRKTLELTTRDSLAREAHHDPFAGRFDIPTQSDGEKISFRGNFDLKCHTMSCGP